GIGENVPMVRERMLTGLEELWIELDLEANAPRSRQARVISTPQSRVTVMLVPTNEELSIAQQADEVARSARVHGPEDRVGTTPHRPARRCRISSSRQRIAQPGERSWSTSSSPTSTSSLRVAAG